MAHGGHTTLCDGGRKALPPGDISSYQGVISPQGCCVTFYFVDPCRQEDGRTCVLVATPHLV